MKQYIVTNVCSEKLENVMDSKIEILGEEIEKTFLKCDIPKRINSSKTITRYDKFSGWLFVTTITRIK